MKRRSVTASTTLVAVLGRQAVVHGNNRTVFQPQESQHTHTHTRRSTDRQRPASFQFDTMERGSGTASKGSRDTIDRYLWNERKSELVLNVLLVARVPTRPFEKNTHTHTYIS